MKTIFLFIVGFCIVNQIMAQCDGGTLVGQNFEICVGTTTGSMNVGNFTGTVDQWEYSTNGGSYWNYAGGGYTSYSEVINTTGTYIFRVKVSYNGSTCYSTTKTITVKNAVGGTISTGGGGVCIDNTGGPLTLTGHFAGQGGSIEWEYSTNGGSTYNLAPSSLGSNPYSPPFSIIGGTGSYMFRARASCGISPDALSSNTKTYQVNNPTAAAVCNDADDLRKAVAKVHISGIPYDFSGFLVNHSSQDGRLLFLTSSHPFTSHSPSSTDLNNATFTWNEDINSCGGGSSSITTSTGCSILVTDGFFTLLQLNKAPDLEQLYYLGWDYNANGNYNTIFQSAASIKKGKVSTSGTTATVSGNFSGDDFTESTGSGVLKISSWSSGNTEKRGRGAPLLAGSVGKKARGVYIGGAEENCGNGPSYFAYLHSGLTGLLGYLRDGSETNTASVSMNYCKPSETLSGPLSQSIPPYSVTGSIVSTQQISDGFVVRYQAGTYIELNDGFYSGTDFVAEINPCIINRTVIAAKTDDVFEEPQQSVSIPTIGGIKIYPTVISSGSALTIEVSEQLENGTIILYDIQTKAVQYVSIPQLYANGKFSFAINELPAGLYFAKVQSNTISITQKIIVQ